MRIGSSIMLIAVGAVLRFALETSVEGINLGVTGVILMIVGGVGLAVSLLLYTRASPSRGASIIDGETVVRETVTTHERDVV